MSFAGGTLLRHSHLQFGAGDFGNGVGAPIPNIALRGESLFKFGVDRDRFKRFRLGIGEPFLISEFIKRKFACRQRDLKHSFG